MVKLFDLWSRVGRRRPRIDAEELLKRSETFCMAPWSHIHVLPSGKIFTCCMAAHLKKNAVGDLHGGDSLESAWNSRKMREIRRSMLTGGRIALCERCYIAEENNQHSFRQSINLNMSHHFDMVSRTEPDGTLGVFKIPYLDIRFSNLCNYRCRICCPELSSGWYEDALELGSMDGSKPKILNAAGGESPLLADFYDLLDDVETIFFAGGEPLIMEEHYEIVNRLIEKKRRATHISYNTNCSVLGYKGHRLPEMWKEFDDIFILASLDGSHERGDYMRKGQKWDLVEENIGTMRKECPHVRFRLSPTVSLFNAYHLLDFYRELLDKGLIRVDEIATNILLEPEMYSVKNFPPRMKSELTGLYEEFVTAYLEEKKASEETKGHFRAVVNYMNSGDLNKLGRFRWVTRRLDEIRGEDFSSVFPELEELMG